MAAPRSYARAQDEVPVPGRLGASDVPTLALGTMMFGTPMDFDKSYETVTHAFKHGINFFDTAETYSNGQSEVIMYPGHQEGYQLAQFSIAWCAANEHVSSVILGAMSTKQIVENLKTLKFVDKMHARDPRQGGRDRAVQASGAAKRRVIRAPAALQVPLRWNVGCRVPLPSRSYSAQYIPGGSV